MAASSTCSNVNAPSSDGTRKSSRRARRPPSRPAVRAGDGRGGGRGGARVGVPQRRHHRVPSRGRGGRRALLLPRDEHAASGGAPGHRSGHRCGPRARAADGRGRRARCPGHRTSCRSAVTRSSAASMPKIRGTGSFRRPARCCSTGSRRAPGFASTRASGKGPPSRSTTTRCSRSSRCSAESRDAAIARALAALRSFPVLGIRTNIPFLIRLLDHREVRAGRLHTGFIDQHLDELIARRETPAEAVAAAAVTPRRPSLKASAARRCPSSRRFAAATRWIRGPRSASGDDSAAQHRSCATPAGEHRATLEDDGSVSVATAGGFRRSAAEGGASPRRRPSASARWTAATGETRWVFLDGDVFELEVQPEGRRRRGTGAPGIAVGADARDRRAR